MRRVPAAGAAAVAEAGLALALAYVGAALLWAWLSPDLPAGSSAAAASGPSAPLYARPVAGLPDYTILTETDPFHPDAPAGSQDIRRQARADAPETTLDLKLHGVRLGAVSRTGTATIQTPDRKQNVYAIGDEIIDGVVLEAIFPESVTISRRGVAESVRLSERYAADRQMDAIKARHARVRAPAPPTADGPSRPSAQTEAPPAETALPNTVAEPQTAAPTVEAVEAALPRISDGAAFIRALALTPETGSDGAMTGMAIGSGANRSLLEKAHLEPGDVVRAVEGVDLSDRSGLVALQPRLAQAERLSLDVDRGGRRTRVTVELNEFR